MTMVEPPRRGQRTFGVEEEVMLLDPASLAPVDVAHEVIDEIAPREGGAAWVGHEFLRAQLEFSSPVLADGDAAARVVGEFRRAVAGAAGRRDLVAASVGAPIGAGGSRVAVGERYTRFDEELAAIRPDHAICGLHVHVGVGSRDEGVVVLRALRPWLAPLLALTANSPCFAGRDTGFSSWRTIVSRRFTTMSVPPAFVDAADYDRRIRTLIGLGATFDPASVSWMARLAERYPTVELRLFDAQLAAADTVATALLARAVVDAAAAGALPHVPEAAHPEAADAAVWHAARHGLDDGLLDPRTAALAPAWEVLDALLALVRPALEAAGDAARVDDAVGRIRRLGTGAARQRAAHRQGVAAHARLLRSSFAAIG